MKARWHTRALRSMLVALLALGVSQLPTVASAAMFDGPAQQRLLTGFGSSAALRANHLDRFLSSLASLERGAKVALVNAYLNRFPFREDASTWGESDRWAMPVEFLGRHGGDCEDYAITKYFALRSIGIPDDALRIAYVEMSGGGSHMVLLYRDAGNGENLVLDNLAESVQPLSRRSDLLVRYAFNSRTVTVYGTGAEAGISETVEALPASAGRGFASTTVSGTAPSAMTRLSRLMQRMRELRPY